MTFFYFCAMMTVEVLIQMKEGWVVPGMTRREVQLSGLGSARMVVAVVEP
jgi:hypothetical protein